MVVCIFYFFSLTRSVIVLTKKFRDFDWLKTSACKGRAPGLALKMRPR